MHMEITQNFDKIISNIMPFYSAKISLPLPSPDLERKVFTKLAKNPHFLTDLQYQRFVHKLLFQ